MFKVQARLSLLRTRVVVTMMEPRWLSLANPDFKDAGKGGRGRVSDDDLQGSAGDKTFNMQRQSMTPRRLVSLSIHTYQMSSSRHTVMLAI